MGKTLEVDRSRCCDCGGCVGVCPARALDLREDGLSVDREKCTMCGVCLAFCPVEALASGEGPAAPLASKANIVRTDVVIVGAGPAGSICAKFLARSGRGVLVVDKKQEIGVPKRCAEAVEPDTFEAVGIEPSPLWLTNRIQAAVLYAPNGASVRFGAHSSAGSGFIIERKVFEKHLAKDAIRAGARYMLKTMAQGVIRENGRVKGLVVRSAGTETKVLADIVIAADGVDSMIAKSAGLETVNRLDDYMSCFQYEMAGLRNVDEAAIHLYYGNEVAPGGYVWIFPKRNTLANVGVGIKPLKAENGTARRYLDRFIEKHPDIFAGASAVEFNSGGVPVNPKIEALAGDGLMIIGDAAHLVNPATGGGIRLAMISGRMAAEVAVLALREGDVGRKSLGRYQKNWDAGCGRDLRRMLKLQKFTDGLTDDDLNKLAGLLTAEILEELAVGRYGGLVRLLLKKSPSLARFGLKYLNS